MTATVAGRYQLGRKIGAGGMGNVFEATDTQTGKHVAAKVMIANDEDNLEPLLRFYQEGALLSTLKHPNIVQVYGTFLEDQTCSIIMELLEGQSLATLLRQERLSLGRIKRIGLQVAAALQYAHSRGIVHRDVKPGNIMVLPRDDVKVTDFGIARILRAGATLNTMTGMSLGTPLYMAPEQIEAHKVDGRADIYSLGSVLYHMVTGRPPFEGEDPLSIAFKQVHKQPAPPSTIDQSLPEDWESVILTALQKDPARRFATAVQMGEAIAALSEDPADSRRPSERRGASTLAEPEPVTVVAERRQVTADVTAVVLPATPPPVVPSPQSKRRYTPWLVGGALLFLAALAAGLLALRASGGKTSPTAVPRVTVSRVVKVYGGAGAGGLRSPQSAAVGGKASLYVADFGNNRVQELSPSNSVIRSYGSGPSAPVHLNGPTGVAVDHTGNVFVADSRDGRVVELSPSGQTVHSWGTSGSGQQLNGVHGLTLDRSGNVYAADFGNNRIVKLPASGAPLTSFGGPGSGPGQFNGPVDLTIDSAGNIYVADFSNSRIQKLSPSGKPLQQFTQWGKTGTSFGRPHGVAVDGRGNIYVADYQNAVVDEISPAGKFLYEWGPSGNTIAHFGRPAAVTVDSHGDLFVVDEVKNNIVEFSPAP